MHFRRRLERSQRQNDDTGVSVAVRVRARAVSRFVLKKFDKMSTYEDVLTGKRGKIQHYERVVSFST